MPRKAANPISIVEATYEPAQTEIEWGSGTGDIPLDEMVDAIGEIDPAFVDQTWRTLSFGLCVPVLLARAAQRLGATSRRELLAIHLAHERARRNAPRETLRAAHP
jgi:hypothetical protein